jgi:hypothetical protein
MNDRTGTARVAQTDQTARTPSSGVTCARPTHTRGAGLKAEALTNVNQQRTRQIGSSLPPCTGVTRLVVSIVIVAPCPGAAGAITARRCIDSVIICRCLGTPWAKG